MIKNHFRTILVLVLCTGLLIFIVFDKSSLLRSPKSLGRLVFTDYAKPNYSFTVDVFDLKQGIRSSLNRVDYQDVGIQSVIDEQHVYFSACFAQNNPMFCSAYVSVVIAPEEIHKFDHIRQFWKEIYGSPIFSPDGTRIAFTVVNNGTQSDPLYRGDTYVMNADGTHIVDLTPSEENNGFYFSWSPDSRVIAFTCVNQQNLCIANADGGNLQQLSVPQNTNVHDVMWSPDGSQIVFSLSAKDFHNAELYLVNADGSNMHRLLEAGSNDHENPVWSPDGSRIAFRSGEQNNNVGEIYTVKSDGSDLHDLSQGLDGNEYGMVWSPNSSKVAFFSNQYQKGTYLYIVDADGTNLQQITENSRDSLTDTAAPDLLWIP
jgi:TolB protein